VAVTESEVVSRQMCLLWGVTPLEGAPTRASVQLIKFIEEWGRREGCLSPGDHILLVSGIGLVATGHNMLVVHEVAAAT
jgi:pyruvate kinase